MKLRRMRLFYSLLAASGLLVAGTSSRAADTQGNTTVPVRMTVTASVSGKKQLPEIRREDVIVRQGKNRLEVTEWVPARGDRAGLELFILIDESADPRIGSQFDDLKEFINSQPASTLVGVGYMRNATVQIAQNLTTDHSLAAESLRLPLGYSGAYGSPFLSVIDLMKGWPVDQNRREVIMLTNGVGRDRHHIGLRRGYSYDPDVETASSVAQKTGTNIFTIYNPGARRYRHHYWAQTNGQLNMTRLSDSTGGASFYLGLHSPVSFRPYLMQLQTIFDNQYLLSFSANPGRHSGLQHINLGTEVSGVDLSGHDAVWVAGEK